MRKTLVFPALALCLAAFSSSGCAPSQTMQAVGKMGQIMMNPNLPVGQQNADKPSMATIIIYADKNANKSEYGDAPVDILVFQLKDKDELENADYMSLLENPKGVLESSYIRHMKKQVAPGKSTIVTPFKLTDDTAFIGVAVAYANMNNATWKAVEKVNATGEQYKILIPVTRQSVSVQIHR